MTPSRSSLSKNTCVSSLRIILVTNIISTVPVFGTYKCLKGRVFIFGYDVDGRPGFLVIPDRESTPEGLGWIRQYVWIMERAVEIMPRGVE